MKSLAVLVFTAGLAFAGNASAQEVIVPASGTSSLYLIPVADGCGPGWYRGPGGACHRNGFGPGRAGWVGPGGAWHPYWGGARWHVGWGCGWRCRHGW
jgi:hypothetical protein